MPSRYSEAVYRDGAVIKTKCLPSLVVYKFHNLPGMKNLISTPNYYFLKSIKLKLI